MGSISRTLFPHAPEYGFVIGAALFAGGAVLSLRLPRRLRVGSPR